MLEAPAPTEHSPPTVTGPTSPPRLSFPPKANKPQCSPASPPLLAVAEVPTPHETSTALRLASILTRETLVRETPCRQGTDTTDFDLDIVGNNVPVFFIQDAILFPDLIHAVKPRGDNEIPQAATAHDSAWDFFSQQPSALHTLIWAMAGHGIPRSFRHTNGFGVHTYRFVTDDGKTKLVKFHWTGLQGKASFVWEEAQQIAGKNADFMRQDLFEAIEAGRFPEWEVSNNPPPLKSIPIIC